MDFGDLVTVSSPEHHDALAAKLWESFTKKQNVDYFFQWRGLSVVAHQLILETFLPAKKLDQCTRWRKGPTESSDDDQVNLESLVEFLYRGTVTVSRGRLIGLLKLAKEFSFKLMVDAVQNARKQPDPRTGSPDLQPDQGTVFTDPPGELPNGHLPFEEAVSTAYEVNFLERDIMREIKIEYDQSWFPQETVAMEPTDYGGNQFDGITEALDGVSLMDSNPPEPNALNELEDPENAVTPRYQDLADTPMESIDYDGTRFDCIAGGLEGVSLTEIAQPLLESESWRILNKVPLRHSELATNQPNGIARGVDKLPLLKSNRLKPIILRRSRPTKHPAPPTSLDLAVNPPRKRTRGLGQAPLLESNQSRLRALITPGHDRIPAPLDSSLPISGPPGHQLESLGSKKMLFLVIERASQSQGLRRHDLAIMGTELTGHSVNRPDDITGSLDKVLLMDSGQTGLDEPADCGRHEGLPNSNAVAVVEEQTSPPNGQSKLFPRTHDCIESNDITGELDRVPPMDSCLTGVNEPELTCGLPNGHEVTASPRKATSIHIIYIKKADPKRKSVSLNHKAVAEAQKSSFNGKSDFSKAHDAIAAIPSCAGPNLTFPPAKQGAPTSTAAAQDNCDPSLASFKCCSCLEAFRSFVLLSQHVCKKPGSSNTFIFTSTCNSVNTVPDLQSDDLEGITGGLDNAPLTDSGGTGLRAKRGRGRKRKLAPPAHHSLPVVDDDSGTTTKTFRCQMCDYETAYETLYSSHLHEHLPVVKISPLDLGVYWKILEKAQPPKLLEEVSSDDYQLADREATSTQEAVSGGNKIIPNDKEVDPKSKDVILERKAVVEEQMSSFGEQKDFARTCASTGAIPSEADDLAATATNLADGVIISGGLDKVPVVGSGRTRLKVKRRRGRRTRLAAPRPRSAPAVESCVVDTIDLSGDMTKTYRCQLCDYETACERVYGDHLLFVHFPADEVAQAPSEADDLADEATKLTGCSDASSGDLDQALLMDSGRTRLKVKRRRGRPNKLTATSHHSVPIVKHNENFLKSREVTSIHEEVVSDRNKIVRNDKEVDPKSKVLEGKAVVEGQLSSFNGQKDFERTCASTGTIPSDADELAAIATKLTECRANRPDGSSGGVDKVLLMDSGRTGPKVKRRPGRPYKRAARRHHSVPIVESCVTDTSDLSGTMTKTYRCQLCNYETVCETLYGSHFSKHIPVIKVSKAQPPWLLEEIPGKDDILSNCIKETKNCKDVIPINREVVSDHNEQVSNYAEVDPKSSGAVPDSSSNLSSTMTKTFRCRHCNYETASETLYGSHLSEHIPDSQLSQIGLGVCWEMLEKTESPRLLEVACEQNESLSSSAEETPNFKELTLINGELVSDVDEVVSGVDELVSDVDAGVSDVDEVVSDVDEVVSDVDEVVSDNIEVKSYFKGVIPKHQAVVEEQTSSPNGQSNFFETCNSIEAIPDEAAPHPSFSPTKQSVPNLSFKCRSCQEAFGSFGLLSMHTCKKRGPPNTFISTSTCNSVENPSPPPAKRKASTCDSIVEIPSDAEPDLFSSPAKRCAPNSVANCDLTLKSFKCRLCQEDFQSFGLLTRHACKKPSLPDTIFSPRSCVSVKQIPSNTAPDSSTPPAIAKRNTSNPAADTGERCDTAFASFQCRSCQEAFGSFGLISRHVCKELSSPNPAADTRQNCDPTFASFKCRSCQEAFGSFGMLSRHACKKRDPPKTFFIPCKSVSVNESQSNTVTDSSSPPAKRSSPNLAADTRENCDPTIASFKCRLCQKAFQNFGLLSRHACRKQGLPKFLPVSEVAPVGDEDLDGHLIFWCVRCEFTFRNKGLLDLHVCTKRDRSGDLPRPHIHENFEDEPAGDADGGSGDATVLIFKCSRCRKSFANKGLIDIHVCS